MKDTLAKVASKAGPLGALVVVFSLFAILGGRDFCNMGAMRDILMLSVIVGVAALGATLIIITGGIDLSVGCTIATVTILIAQMFNVKSGGRHLLELHPVLWPLACLMAGVVAGALIGAFIGSLVIGYGAQAVSVLVGLLVARWLAAGAGWALAAAAPVGIIAAAALWFASDLTVKKTPLPPFIVTLGLWASLRGGAKWLSDSSAVYPDITRTNGGTIWLNRLMRDVQAGGIVLPMPGVWIWVVLAILVGLTLTYTRFGRHVYAVGSNENTARLCGINVERTKLLTYVLAILIAGIAGVLRFSFLEMGDPTTDMGTELLVIASVVIGGASLGGGVGSVGGTMIGTLIIMTVYKGCTVLGLPNFVQEIVTGAIIVAAVALDQMRRGRTE